MQKREYLNFEGITISSYEYGEFDKIFNILSPHKGIITAIIKRIRKTSNKNFDYIDVFQKMNFKASITDNFYIIYEAKSVETWFERPIKLTNLSSGNIIAELTINFNSINENNNYIYHLVSKCLKWISNDIFIFTLVYFQIKLLLAEGIFPEINICLNCNNKIQPGDYLLNLIESGIFCNKCSEKTKFSSLKLLEQEIRLLKHIKNTEYDNNLNINNIITKKVELNLYKKLSTYIKFYTNKELKSEKILFSSLNK